MVRRWIRDFFPIFIQLRAKGMCIEQNGVDEAVDSGVRMKIVLIWDA